MALLERGDSIYQVMQVTGEEGISLEDFIEWQKSVLLDMAYLQQDAFDEVDANMPRARQLASFRLLKKLLTAEFKFQDKDAARDFFTRITGLYKNWNYSRADSPDYERYMAEIEQLAGQYQSPHLMP
jgi:V/A-type H+-transporting ATPase subunit A